MIKLGGNWNPSNNSSDIAAVALPSLHHPLSYNDQAHLTLVYAGDDPQDINVTGLRSLVKQLARGGAPFTAEIIGQDLFGDNRDEPVLLLEHPEFKAMRRVLESYNRSSYPQFIPHVAVPTLEGINRMPSDVAFDRLGFWIGNDRENWWLGSGAPTRM